MFQTTIAVAAYIKNALVIIVCFVMDVLVYLSPV